MTTEKIKAVASDLDGTLLLNGAKILDDKSFAAIHALSEAGIRFIVASGRQYHSLCALFAPVKDEISFICENGTMSVCEGETVDIHYMDHALALKMINEIMDRDDMELLVSCRNTCYMQPKEEWYLHHMRDVIRNDVTVIDNIRTLEEPIMKVSLLEPNGLFDTAYWKKQYGAYSTVVTGGNNWLDMMPQGIHKATGLEGILRHYGIRPEECAAFGDNENDREMLKYVGLPVTMVTADATVKDLGRIHVDNVPDALYRIIDETFLPDAV